MQEQPEFSSGEEGRRVGVSPSESVPVFLPFPGTNTDTQTRAKTSQGEFYQKIHNALWEIFKGHGSVGVKVH